ncbi:MAG: OmpA family protein [Nannocystis sp.]|nr:OmpA family protein [Nannocystis sp.]
MPAAPRLPLDTPPGAWLLPLLLACAPRPAAPTDAIPPAEPARAAPPPPEAYAHPAADERRSPPHLADADTDGLPDIDDRCPDEPGVDDHDGCPEPPRLPVIICQRPIRGVNFGTGSPGPLAPASRPILDEVAGILRDFPELCLHVIGHADPHEGRGEADRRARARARAQLVKDELARRGADPSRLDVVSDGSSHPVDSRDTLEARASNRRVEFRVIDGVPPPKPAERTTAAPRVSAAHLAQVGVGPG